MTSADPTTVSALLARARAQLARCEVDSPDLTARVLLEQVTERSRTALLAHPDLTPTPDEVTRFWALIERRCQREPLAYLFGSREFYGRSFAVNAATLIPRPETEGLVDRALAWIDANPGPNQCLDVGTGSGAIAVTLLAERPNLRVIATDIHLAALHVARENALRHGVLGRLRLVATSLSDGLRCRVPLLVANLPYIPSNDIGRLAPEVARFEPREALDGGADGMRPIATLLSELRRVVAPGGTALFEIGDQQGQALQVKCADLHPGCDVRVEADAAGRDRYLIIRLPDIND